MPMFYGVVPGVLQTTNATPNTENDALFIKPGATRNVILTQLLMHGKAAGVAVISGITARIKKWTTTASSGGTGITPAPKDPGFQAAKATAGYAVAAVTSGTGGPSFQGSFGCGAAGPGGWTSTGPDDVTVAEAAANHSIDVFVSSGSISLNYELMASIAE